jgi:hypothetical protein
MLSLQRTLVVALVVLVAAAGGGVHAQCTGYGDGDGGLNDHTDCCDIAHSDGQSACTSTSNYDAGQSLKAQMPCTSVTLCTNPSINCYRLCPQTCASILAEAGICVSTMGGFTTPTGGLAQCCPSQAVADVDNCVGDPCGATTAGTCSDTGADSYDCACNFGYTFSDGTCADVDDLDYNNVHPRYQAVVCVLTDVNEHIGCTNFRNAVLACLYDAPADGECFNRPFGPMSGWDTSRVTNMHSGVSVHQAPHAPTSLPRSHSIRAVSNSGRV